MDCILGVLTISFTLESKTVGRLVYKGTDMAPGIYDSNTTPGFITGTGSLTVAEPLSGKPR